MNRTFFYGLNKNNFVLVVADLIVFMIAFILSMLALSLLNKEVDKNPFEIALLLELIIFSLPLHLCLLAVGLYNEKLRENYNPPAHSRSTCLHLKYRPAC